MDMKEFQRDIVQRLMASSITPGRYFPTPTIREVPSFAAVFVLDSDGRDTLAVVCGPADDPVSVAQADALAASDVARRLFNGRLLVSGMVATRALAWPEHVVALARKPPGLEIDPLRPSTVMALLMDFDGFAFQRAACLCACTETARAIDPGAPDMGDAATLLATAEMLTSQQPGAECGHA